MKKYSFLVYHKQYVDFLEKLREIGVLHVIEKQKGITENDALREKMQLAAWINTASLTPVSLDASTSALWVISAF